MSNNIEDLHFVVTGYKDEPYRLNWRQHYDNVDVLNVYCWLENDLEQFHKERDDKPVLRRKNPEPKRRVRETVKDYVRLAIVEERFGGTRNTNRIYASYQ